MRRLTVLAGPGGVGKGSVVAALRELEPALWVSVSWTTRRPRPGEVDGEHYVFVDEATFAAAVAAGAFLEHAQFAGSWYGTPRAPVEAALARGPALLEIDVQGARQVRAAMPEALLVLLTPPSLEELARRLAGRGTDDAAGLAQRLSLAEQELAAAPEFDAVLVNDDLGSAAARLLTLVHG
jgi:guanylate kinase